MHDDGIVSPTERSSATARVLLSASLRAVSMRAVQPGDSICNARLKRFRHSANDVGIAKWQVGTDDAQSEFDYCPDE